MAVTKIYDGQQDDDAVIARSTVETLVVDGGSTGWLSDGGMSTTGTSVTIAAGTGQIVDTSTVPPTITRLAWPETVLDWSAVAEGQQQHVYVDDTATVQYRTAEPTHAEWRSLVWLHRGVVRSGQVTGATSIAMPARQHTAQLWDVWRAYGAVKRGLELAPATGGGLTLRRAAGELYGPGINTTADVGNPHENEFATADPLTFQHRDRNNVSGGDTTTLDVGQWDNAGTVEAIPGATSRAAIHAVYMFPSGNTRFARPQAWYATLSAAVEAVATYAPAVPSNFSDAIVIGWVVATKGATDLTDPAQAVFVTSNRFGGAGGGTAAAGLGSYLEVANNLSDVADAGAARTNLGIDLSLYALLDSSPTFTGAVEAPRLEAVRSGAAAQVFVDRTDGVRGSMAATTTALAVSYQATARVSFTAQTAANINNNALDGAARAPVQADGAGRTMFGNRTLSDGTSFPTPTNNFYGLSGVDVAAFYNASGTLVAAVTDTGGWTGTITAAAAVAALDGATLPAVTHEGTDRLTVQDSSAAGALSTVTVQQVIDDAVAQSITEARAALTVAVVPIVSATDLDENSFVVWGENPPDDQTIVLELRATSDPTSTLVQTLTTVTVTAGTWTTVAVPTFGPVTPTVGQFVHIIRTAGTGDRPPRVQAVG